jgi:hypothetical protein
LENEVDDEEVPDMDINPTIDIQWKEGVEHYQDTTKEVLWARLGITDEKIPLFNEVQDPDGERDPWNPEWRQWFDDPKNTMPLEPRWHQLVGMLSIVERLFQGHPVLLMDGVGLGKTMQMVGVIALLAYFREYYAIHSRFPGSFGKSELIR